MHRDSVSSGSGLALPTGPVAVTEFYRNCSESETLHPSMLLNAKM